MIFNLKDLFVFSKNKRKNSKYVQFLIFCVIFLCIFGCFMVYSASSYNALKHYGSSTFFLKKQIIGCFIGFVSLIFFSFFDYQKLKRFRWVILIISIVGLLFVFVPGIGFANYGARRWIRILGLSFQPSELAKFALVLFCASYLSDNYKKIKNFRKILPPIFVGGVLCLLVILEPNMSITMCLALTLVVMLVVGGISKKHFSIFACLGACTVPALIIAEPYRIKRLVAFVDPWANPKGEGFQLIQSLYALGNGGLFGVGLFNSRQKYLFLPFSESDFIFSIIGEELGLVGAVFVLLAFTTIIFLYNKNWALCKQ